MDLRTLNDAQREAVTAPGGFHLVIAGAGTGKTRTLVHRVAWLIDRGADPAGIVLLTFTRRAANEMLHRASGIVGPAARRVRGGTFHAFANRVLRPHATHVGRTRDFTVLDRHDAEALVSLVRQDLGLAGQKRRFPRKTTLLGLISRSANTGLPLAETVERFAPQLVDDIDDIQAVARAYRQRKERGDLVDFDDLLLLLRRVLKRSPDVRRAIAGRCHHVLVDEYQDTNRVQGHIAALLATSHGNLMVVGDEAQSIYAFRGATVTNILDFPRVFPGVAQTVLEVNYRSTQPVLDLANAVLASSREGFPKRLRSREANGPRPCLVQVEDNAAEVDHVVERVLALREQGVPLNEQAVLFRSTAHSLPLEVALARANIPFRKYGGTRFTEAAHVKDLVCMLRVIANPRDEVAWARVLLWIEGIGPRTAARIVQAILGASPPHLDPTPWSGRSFGPALTELAELVERAGFAPFTELIPLVVDAVSANLETRYADAWKRQRDLEGIPLLARRYASLETFLADLTLDPPARSETRPDDAEDEWLTLSTIHSAKGLEWSAVYLIELIDGHFPASQALDDGAAMEEERRLLYVALTRAKRYLYLLQPRITVTRRWWGERAFAPGCTLLDEIDDLDGLVDTLAPTLPQEDEDAPASEGDQQRLAAVLAWVEE